MSKLIATFAIATLLAAGGAGAAAAKTCHDAKGKFVACAAAPAAKKVCKDAKGKFMKCPAHAAR
ncbi:hypothetical protein [Phenylobacterium sp.]|jgi:hypothetical protein|uniref:hypothetical protein n=1 Tax=Phenylobacterium sp. TaxID=1871053 RepID=UPI002F3E5BD8